MALDAFDDQCTGANPRYPLIEELKEIYKRAYYGTAKEVKAVAKAATGTKKVAKKTTKKK
jgi:acetaldehyde dehydrogenase/alcohol dehydrogenase